MWLALKQWLFANQNPGSNHQLDTSTYLRFYFVFLSLIYLKFTPPILARPPSATAWWCMWRPSKYTQFYDILDIQIWYIWSNFLRTCLVAYLPPYCIILYVISQPIIIPTIQHLAWSLITTRHKKRKKKITGVVISTEWSNFLKKKSAKKCIKFSGFWNASNFQK